MLRSRVRMLAPVSALGLCAVTLFGLSVPAGATDQPVFGVTAGQGTATPHRVTGVHAKAAKGDAAKAARAYLGDNRSTYRIADPQADLSVLDVSGGNGTETVRFQQRYKGVPVFGAHYLVHLGTAGPDTEVLGANGNYYTGLDTDVDAKATTKQAVDRAEAYVTGKVTGGRFTAGDPPAVTARSEGLVVIPDGTGILAYQIRVETTDPAKRVPVVKKVFVDADTAWPYMAIDGIEADTPVQGTGVTYAGNEVPLQLTLADDGSYQFIDRSKDSKAKISTYDAQAYYVYQVAGTMPSDIKVFSGPASRFDGEATESGLVDAHVNAGLVHDYYRSLGRDSLDGKGGDIVSLVGVTDYGRPYVNAFWDGQKMVYGGGDAEHRTMSADLDVDGHEMTHGVIEHTAGLIYAQQSGAVNEGLADYFGNAIDVNHSGTTMSDPDSGLLGEDLCRTASPRECAQRDLGDGRTTSDFLGLTYDYDNGGVHDNSTIFSGALWDIRKALGGDAADRLVYKALTEYMTPTDDFVAARDAVVHAAQDTHVPSHGMGQIISAFNKHGIKPGWDVKSGDAKILMNDLTTSDTGPAAAGGWWVQSRSNADGTEPYAIYSGRTDGSGQPIKLSDPIDGRFNVLPATDGHWAVWFAWGSGNALVMRAPIDGSGEPEVVASVSATPSQLSVDGDWIAWTADLRGLSKQMYVDAANHGIPQMVDLTYTKRSGYGSVKDGKLYYLLSWPDTKDYYHPHTNVVVRDLAHGDAETMLDEFLADGGQGPAGHYAPKVTDDRIVIGVDQTPGGPAGLWTMNLDGSDRKTIISEQSVGAPMLGGYDATDKAVTFENWPGDVPPSIKQIPVTGGAIQPMTCATGLQYMVNADEGTRAVWLDGSYGSTSLVVRDGPRQHC